jgi:histone H1/5
MPAKAKTTEAPYFKFIQDFIVSEALRNGSSRPAIKKYVEANRKEFQSGTFNRCLKMSVASEKLVAVKGRFKLGAAVKAAIKKAAAPPKKKKAAPKKKAATKKVGWPT